MGSGTPKAILSDDADRLVSFLRTARANSPRSAASMTAIREWTGIDARRMPSIFIELVNAGIILLLAGEAMGDTDSAAFYVAAGTTRTISAARRKLGLAIHPIAQSLESATSGADERDCDGRSSGEFNSPAAEAAETAAA